MKKESKVVIVIVSLFVLFVSLFIMWLSGWPLPRVSIEQEVYVSSILEDTYTVRTDVWVYHGGMTIERSWRAYSIKCDAVRDLLDGQLILAEEVAAKVRERVKTFEYCEH